MGILLDVAAYRLDGLRDVAADPAETIHGKKLLVDTTDHASIVINPLPLAHAAETRRERAVFVQGVLIEKHVMTNT